MHSGIRGFGLCATMPLRFVAARLPVPPGAGPATRLPPPRNAEAFRYKMRRRCIRGFGLCATMPLRFVAARLPAPTGVGPAARPPPSERGGVPLQNATAMHSGIRPLRDDAFAFCSGAASRADGSGARSSPAPLGTRRRSATKCGGDAFGDSGIRGFGLCATMPLRFVAARLPAPTGAGPATRLPPPRNAEAFRYKMRRRRCIRGFGLCATMPLRFVAARLSAPTGVGPATHRTPGRNAEAFRYKMRRRRCGCGPCAARKFRVSFQRLLVTPPPERGGVPLQNAARPLLTSDL